MTEHEIAAIERLAAQVVQITLESSARRDAPTKSSVDALADRALVAGLTPGVGQDATAWEKRAILRIALELAELLNGPTVPPRERPASLVVVPPILIVEDSPTAAALTEQALSTIGLSNPVILATTIADAAVAITEEFPPPALVLLDYELPDGRGIDLLHRPDVRESLGAAPVIMLSSHEESSEINEAYRLGVAAYLVKPVAFDAVEGLVRNLPLPWFLARVECEVA